MSTLARGARAGALVLAALLLVLVPDLAAAKFVGTRAAPLNVSTATMVAPTNVAGTYRCTTLLLNEGITITVTGFTDNGPAATGYRYTLRVDGAVATTSTSTSKSVTISGSQFADRSTNTWTIEVQATIGGWTSPAGSASVDCKRGSTKSGNL